jgi:hypothetical protein
MFPSSQITRKIVEAYRQVLRDSSVDLVELAEVSRKIFIGLDTGLVFLHLCQEGETNSGVLMEEFGLPESSTYRVLKMLQDMGVIEVIHLLPHKPRTGGPRRRLWGIVR